MTVTAEDVAKTCEERALRVVSSKLFPLNPDAADKYEQQAALVLALEKVRVAVIQIYNPGDHGEDCEAWYTEAYGPDYDDSKCDCGLARITEALAECDRIMKGEGT